MLLWSLVCLAHALHTVLTIRGLATGAPKSVYLTNFYVVTGRCFLFDPGQIRYRASVRLSSCFFYLLKHHNLYPPMKFLATPLLTVCFIHEQINVWYDMICLRVWKVQGMVMSPVQLVVVLFLAAVVVSMAQRGPPNDPCPPRRNPPRLHGTRPRIPRCIRNTTRSRLPDFPGGDDLCRRLPVKWILVTIIDYIIDNSVAYIRHNKTDVVVKKLLTCAVDYAVSFLH